MDCHPSDHAEWPWTPSGDPDAPMPAAPVRIPARNGPALSAAVNWAGVDGETLGAWVQAVDGGRFRLLVEALPDGGWDWIIWHTRDQSRSGCGKAPTASHAMLAAEQALTRIAGESR